MDEHIKSLVPLIESYVRDTPDFIRKITNFSHTGNYFLVTMAVKSLYTNIPNHEGLVAVARALAQHNPDFSISYTSLLELLKLVLHKNNFQCNNEHYLHIGGTAMGTKVAPSFPNSFMGHLESKMIQEPKNRLNIKIPLYLRYIDDIFFIFPHSETKLMEFITLCNGFHHTIKFMEEHSTEIVVFFDCTIIRENNKLHTNLHVKDTAMHRYVRAESCHPRHIIKKGQILRLRHNCFKYTNFEYHLSQVK